MLSYRHGYHAGNHADVLKHLVQCLILQKLTVKDTPVVYIDTHAGAGRYDLNQQWAKRTAEFLQGIEKLVYDSEIPPALQHYVDVVKSFRAENPLAYPGSPAIAQQLLRSQDKLILMELHNNEIDALKSSCRRDKRVSFHHRDGFEGLVGVMPPNIGRGLALIDPSYEVKTDYNHAATSIGKAASLWPTGIFAVWYPLLADERDRSKELLRQLAKKTQHSLLNVQLWVKGADVEFGMHGSGLAIVNVPWQLDVQLQEALPRLTELLAQDEQAGWQLDWLREQP